MAIPEGFIGLVAKVWASGTAALWGNVRPGQTLWALRCEALRRRAGGALFFFLIYFYFLLFVSLPSCSSACIRRTDFPSQELSRLFSFTRGLRDGGEHRKHWGGSQDAPMASPFTLTPLKWSLDIKTVWFWANITKNISLLSASL